MIKNYFLIAFLLLCANLFAQVPNSGNNSATRSSSILKTEVKSVVNNTTDNSTTASQRSTKSDNVLSSKQETPNNQDISIYPNPTTINSISLNTSKNLDVKIYNVLGQKVLSTTVTTQKNKINIETLKSGVYIIKLKSNSGTTTKKLIKK